MTAPLFRTIACLALEVRLDAGPSGGTEWVPGPLPVNAAAFPGTNERELRGTYLDKRVGRGLYGTGDRSARWHSPEVGEALAGAEPLGMELLRFDAAPRGVNAIFVLHVRILEDDVLSALAGLAQVNPRIPTDQPSRALYDRLIAGLGGIPTETTRATCVVFATPADSLRPLYPDDVELPVGWSPRRQWMFHLAAAVPPSRYPPHPEGLSSLGVFLPLSATWEALVLRDGVAFIGRERDSGEDDSHCQSGRLSGRLTSDPTGRSFGLAAG